MIALCIVIAVLLLILMLPVGIDASYLSGQPALKVKAGPVSVRLLPKKEKTAAKPKKRKKRRRPRSESSQQSSGGTRPARRRLGAEDLLFLAKLWFGALNRFRLHLSIDDLLIHLTIAASDPCDAALLYGRVNALLASLSPVMHSVFKIRKEDIRTGVELEQGNAVYDIRMVATIQIWELIAIGGYAGIGFLRWWLKRRKQKRKAGKQQLKTA